MSKKSDGAQLVRLLKESSERETLATKIRVEEYAEQHPDIFAKMNKQARAELWRQTRRTVVEERAREILIRREREKMSSSPTVVRFFKDGNVMGVQTTAVDEREFFDTCAEELAAMIASGKFRDDWGFQLFHWLPQIVDIVCKLRGYKSTVHEQRVITAGFASFSNDALANVSTWEGIKEDADTAVG